MREILTISWHILISYINDLSLQETSGNVDWFLGDWYFSHASIEVATDPDFESPWTHDIKLVVRTTLMGHHA